MFASTTPRREGQGAGRVHQLRALPRIEIRSDGRDRHGRDGIGPGEHRHGSRARRCTPDQDVPLRPVHPDGADAGARDPARARRRYPGAPTQTSEFLAFDESYTGGVSLTTGWVAGEEGGAKSIITGQLAGDGTVRTWSSGSRLDGFPGMYLQSPNHHEADVEFTQISSFAPFSGAAPGSRWRPPAPRPGLICWSAAPSPAVPRFASTRSAGPRRRRRRWRRSWFRRCHGWPA